MAKKRNAADMTGRNNNARKKDIAEAFRQLKNLGRIVRKQGREIAALQLTVSGLHGDGRG